LPLDRCPGRHGPSAVLGSGTGAEAAARLHRLGARVIAELLLAELADETGGMSATVALLSECDRDYVDFTFRRVAKLREAFR
jgi:hypothetical protein